MSLFYKCNSCNTDLNDPNCFTLSLIDKKKALSSLLIKPNIINKYKLNKIIVCDICFDKLTVVDKKEYISIIDSNNFFGLLYKDSTDDKLKLNQKYKYDNIKKEITEFVFPPLPSSPPPNDNSSFFSKQTDKFNNNENAPIKISIKLTKNKKDKYEEDKDEEDDEDEDKDEEENKEQNKDIHNILNGIDKELYNYLFGGSLNNQPTGIIIYDNPIKSDISIKNDKSNTNKTNKQQKRKIDDIDDDLELINLKQIELEKKYDYEWIGDNINNIDDLIELGKSYKERKKKKRRYNLNIKTLHNLVAPLEELKKMIGLTTIKETIFNQVVFYLQELDDKNNDMLHTVIEGPPGVGKTHISKIIAKIYKGLGFLKNDKIVSVKRDDFVGKYLGHTADKTRKKIEEALGGVLFIDEAYSLGDASGKDSYSKEAIDMLTSYLSEHPHDLICIVAGYKDALQRNFFSQNEGLSRRFTHRFELNEYNGEELKHIFFKIVEDNKWFIFDKNEISSVFFETNKKYFKFNGGDMLTLFGYCKKAHSKRLLKIPIEHDLLKTKKKINKDDIKNGFAEFIKNPEYAERGIDLQPLMLYT